MIPRTLWALVLVGCASRGPALSAVGMASPPGRHRNTDAPPTERIAQEGPRTHEESAPLPRHDPEGPTPDVSGAREEVVHPPEGASAGVTGWEDPSGRAAGFLQAVRARQVGVSIVQLGDSHTEGDAWTGAMRRALWRTLGDGGRGFVPVAGAQMDVTRTLTGPWRVVRASLRGSDGPMGIGLARAIATSPAATLRIATCTTCEGGRTASRITVFYRALDQGGTFSVRVDDGALQRVSTRTGDRVVIEVEDVSHSVTVSPVGDGAVEVYGVALDRTTGARIEGAGVIGAQATHLAVEDWSTLSTQLAARAPTLVVLAYGTNESVSARRDPGAYAEALTTMVGQVRAAAPEATVALVGPPDTAFRSSVAGRGYIPAPRLDDVILAARGTAQNQGTLFFDLTALMRARGGVQAWVDARPALAEPDHVHLTRRGYAQLAEAMVASLVGSPSPQ